MNRRHYIQSMFAAAAAACLLERSGRVLVWLFKRRVPHVRYAWSCQALWAYSRRR